MKIAEQVEYLRQGMLLGFDANGSPQRILENNVSLESLASGARILGQRTKSI